MQKTMYLCGPITGCSYEEARYGWRQKVVEAFEDTSVSILSPMRAKPHLSDVPDRESLSALGDPTSVLSCPRGLTTRDRLDTMRSTVIFCNFLGARIPSLGCAIEFGWADAFRIPIVCCIEPEGNPNEHAMLQEIMGWRCSTLEEGISVARAVLTEGL